MKSIKRVNLSGIGSDQTTLKFSILRLNKKFLRNGRFLDYKFLKETSTNSESSCSTTTPASLPNCCRFPPDEFGIRITRVP